MHSFRPGDKVAVPATLQPGAFPGERLVTVATRSGPVSGFVTVDSVVDTDMTINGTVTTSSEDSLSVLLSGSYFTTNGLAEFSADWARKNVKTMA